MALSFNAEKKYIKNIFSTDEQYVVPPYQRPYSWEYDQCFQLYNDLMQAFKEGEDYFIGNIIVAKSEKDKGVLQVVDGQQRTITLLLLIKAMSVLRSDLPGLQKLLTIETLEGNNDTLKIKSDIFELDDYGREDNKELIKIFGYQRNDFNREVERVYDDNKGSFKRVIDTYSRIEANALFFYHWLEKYSHTVDGDTFRNFVHFLRENVSLIPIELTGSTLEDANKKALVIFETINNRGMNLEDADIFKAKLYDKAKRKGEEKTFIRWWSDFKTSCSSLGLKIDDIFRYYSHTIRGAAGITTSEKNLRDFFVSQPNAPLSVNDYQDILNDLDKIIAILQYLNQEKIKATDEAAIWLQVVDAYTNQYPKYAIVNFLYVFGFEENQRFVEFLKSVVRYIYYQGSTTTIKFEIYNIIRDTSKKITIKSYDEEISIENFPRLGRLKTGFALLAYYLTNPTVIPSYTIDRIVTGILPANWENVEIGNVVEELGNFVVLDIPRKNVSFEKKIELYLNVTHFSYNDFVSRNNQLKNSIITFLKNA